MVIIFDNHKESKREHKDYKEDEQRRLKKERKKGELNSRSGRNTDDKNDVLFNRPLPHFGMRSNLRHTVC
eukprot:12652607-Ditylum_brightwellii.AAC.1